MKRYEMVKSHDDFNKIIHKGKKISNKYVIVFRMPKEEEKTNFGIAVGKKLGNAVTRNKLKRQFRAIIDNNRLLFKKYHNYIIMIKREATEESFQVLEKEFIRLLGKEQNEK